jgi:hypothetical protein
MITRDYHVEANNFSMDRVLQQAFRVVLFLRSPIPEPERGHQSEAPFNQNFSMASYSLKLPEPIVPHTFVI